MSNSKQSIHPGPRSSLLLQLIARLFLKITGWKVEGSVPDSARMVIIAAPHTTNWDFIYLLAAALELRLKINWMGKETLFKPPFGYFMRSLGGLAIDRNKHSNIVDEIVTRFDQESKLAVVVPPSGTRKKTQFWKSGFYWIANRAQVPIVCGFLDYERKVAGLGLSFVPTGNVIQDMDRIREFYQDIVGKYPDKESSPRLEEEVIEKSADG